MKILLFWYGSIGRKHHAVLSSLGYNDVDIYDPYASAPTDRFIEHLNDINVWDYDVAFICTPNSLHIQQALFCAQHDIHVFIEKPLSHDLTNLEELKQACIDHNIISMVWCNYRFHPCIAFAKRYIDEWWLGKLYSVELAYGQYLPKMRPWVDYRNIYAAKKELGGGVVLDNIHQYDLLFWLNNFDTVVEHTILKNKVSDLEIETEDISLGVFKFANGSLWSIRGDYLQQKRYFSMKVIGERGNLVCRFDKNQVVLEYYESETMTDQEKVLFQDNSIVTTTMFSREITYFMEQVKNKQPTFNTIYEAETVLSYLLD